MSKKIIKQKNGNQYILSTSGHWVRNFVEFKGSPLDINHLSNSRDQEIFLNNEFECIKNGYPQIDVESVSAPRCVIVSDGYDFARKHRLLAKLPKDISIIGVNGALREWELIKDDCPGDERRGMHFYLNNNPYPEAMQDMPKKHRYFPKCLVSSRTYPNFAKKYQGNVYTYTPVSEISYKGPETNAIYKIDDYRNPICAAIGLAYRFNVYRLLLMCCDDSFEKQKPGSFQLENGLWQYPQQNIAHSLIDANLYWLKQQEEKEVLIRSHSSCTDYENAHYIEEKDILNFFEEDWQ